MINKLKSVLTDNEKILHVAHIHPIVYATPVFNCILALLVAAFFHPLVGGVIMFLNLYPIYTAIVYYNMTDLILTNKKVMCRMGYLSRDWTMMDFDRIENAFLEEPIIGRNLGYSTVIISGVGSGTIAVGRVSNGDEFIKRLEQQMDRSKESGRAK